MASSLDRRIEALESLPGGGKPAVKVTDRELLARVAPDYTGPPPSPKELAAMVHAWVMTPGPVQAPPEDGLTAFERYKVAIDGPPKGGAHGHA